ncbi:MAG: ABC transporter permease [Bacillota bacterium]
MDISQLVASALRMSVPILLAALGAVYTERAGVVNIGLEGMMIAGTFWGAVGAFYYGPLAGVLLGMLAGMVLALIHAVASVTFKINQIVSGVALNILAAGLTRFLCIQFFGMATTSPEVRQFKAWDIPLLDRVDFLKPVVTGISPLIIVALLLVPATAYVLNRTVFGLRLRSVGENPLAADTLGVNVTLMQYAGVLISGALAGLAGTYLAVEHTGMYIEGMTQGRGFIALAAMIFGNWAPVGAMWASFLFGLSESVSFRVVASKVPYQFIKMIPYLVTLVVLAGVVRRATPPAADGIPYERGGE